MKDWIGFNKDAGSEVMAKVGHWNLAVAVKTLAEAMEQHLLEQERKSKELPPITVGETYEVILCSGMKLVGAVDESGHMWIKMRDAADKTLIVRIDEVACFVEHTKST